MARSENAAGNKGKQMGMRRKKSLVAGVAAAMTWMLATSAQAQDPAAAPMAAPTAQPMAGSTAAAGAPRPMARPLIVHPLHDGAFWVEGGSNSAFVVGDKGVIVFDVQRSADGGRELLADIAKVTAKPVHYIVISHGDPDHLGGLPAFAAGTPIAAQENVRSTIMVSAPDPAPGSATYKALIPAFLPTENIAESRTMTLDGVRMVMMHVAPAHTNGDLILFLPSLKMVFAGDIITNSLGPYPVIHIGGSSLGWIESMRAMLALDADTYVGGHGGIESKAMLRDRLRNVEQRRAQIEALVLQNKSLDEIRQALGDASPPGPPGAPRFPTFVETTYGELTKGSPASVPPWTNFVH